MVWLYWYLGKNGSGSYVERTTQNQSLHFVTSGCVPLFLFPSLLFPDKWILRVSACSLSLVCRWATQAYAFIYYLPKGGSQIFTAILSPWSTHHFWMPQQYPTCRTSPNSFNIFFLESSQSSICLAFHIQGFSILPSQISAIDSFLFAISLC